MPANGVTPTINLATPQEMQRVFAKTRQTPFGVEVPKFAIPLTVIGYELVAAYGTANQVQLAQYQAKANWYAVICGLVLQFMGTGPAPNPGDAIFTVDVDRPVGDYTAGYTEKNYGAVPILLGNFTNGWIWPVEWRHSDGEIIRVKAASIANMGVGAGNWFLCAMLGFEWPQQGYEGF